MKKYSKINISLPTEMLEVLDLYAEYEGLTRSGAIGFLLARGLFDASHRTHGFDFDSEYDYYITEEGEKIILKRSDLKNHRVVEWHMACGMNRRKEMVAVNSDDFKEEKNNSEEWFNNSRSCSEFGDLTRTATKEGYTCT